MIDADQKSLPEVAWHPEVLEIPKQIGTEERSPEAGYVQLAEIVNRYLWDGASEGNGELIGYHIAARLFNPNRAWVQKNDPDIWREQLSETGLPVAAARGVLQISVLLGIATIETGAWQGAPLYTKKMTLIFQPSRFLFQSIFTVLRERS